MDINTQEPTSIQRAIDLIISNDYLALQELLPSIDANQRIDLTYRTIKFKLLLTLACYLNNAKVVRCLLSVPDININADGLWPSHRPLYVAIEHNKLEALKELVKQRELDVNNDLYLTYTVESNNKTAFGLLLRHPRINLSLSIDGLQGEDDIALLCSLIDHDQTALELACQLDRLSMIRALVAYGAPITAKAAKHSLLRGLNKLKFDIKLKWKLEFTDPNMYWAASNFLTLMAVRGEFVRLKQNKDNKKTAVSGLRRTVGNKQPIVTSQQAKTARFWSLLQRLDDDTAQKLLLIQTGDTRDFIPAIYLSSQYNLSYLPR